MTDTTETDETRLCGCRHQWAGHDFHPAHGTRTCRSIGHPDGVSCAECRRLLAEKHVAAVMAMRNADDPLLAAAFGGFKATRDQVRHQLGDAADAFFTDVHESAVASALVEYERARLRQARAHVARAYELTWGDWALLLATEADKIQREREAEYQARKDPDGVDYSPLFEHALEVAADARRAASAVRAVLAIVGPIADYGPQDDVGPEEWNLAVRIVQAVGDNLIPSTSDVEPV